MNIVDFEPEHLERVLPQPNQAGFTASMDSIDMALLRRPGLSFSGLSPRGAVLGCAGVVPMWPGVAQAWAVFSEAALREPVTLTRTVMREIEGIAFSLALRRLQATVAEEHREGARWLAFLGFELEGMLVNYGPRGVGDYWMYGRVM